MSFTPRDPHFVHSSQFAARHAEPSWILQAISGTALLRTWRSMIITGSWAAVVVSLNKETSANLKLPTTLITVLGVTLGLTLSYRLSSANDRYNEGRNLWSDLILGCRRWSTTVWLSCPDTLDKDEGDDSDEEDEDHKPPSKTDTLTDEKEARALIEKTTMTRMALAYAVAVKHFLRGEEGILYEDLFDLVRFIPTLYHGPPVTTANDTPAPSTTTSPISAKRTSYRRLEEDDVSTADSFSIKMPWEHQLRPFSSRLGARPELYPARDPPTSTWHDVWPIRYFLPAGRRIEVERRRAKRRSVLEGRIQNGVRSDIPMEISRCMFAWVQSLGKRRKTHGHVLSRLTQAIDKLDETLCKMEKIVTTPIPFAYTVHLWTIAWLYCLLLPFQLCNATENFGWACIPAVMVVTFIVLGFAEIGQEIENPFGYDRNDLNMDYFVEHIIGHEIRDIISTNFPEPTDWIFSPDNVPFGQHDKGSNELQHVGVGAIRQRLHVESKRRHPKARFSVVSI